VAKATVSHDVDSDSPLFSSESDSESLICDLTKKAHLPSDGDKKKAADDVESRHDQKKKAASVLLDLSHENYPIKPTKEGKLLKETPSKQPQVHDTALKAAVPLEERVPEEPSLRTEHATAPAKAPSTKVVHVTASKALLSKTTKDSF